MNKVFRRLFSLLSAVILTVSLCAVSVSAASPKLSKSSAEVSIGYSITLKVTNASGTVKWSSKDSSIAAVKSSGKASAKVSGKKTGTTYIYAKTGGKTLKCKVTVKKSFISASKSSVKITKGKSSSVTLTVKGSKDIYVNNSDKSICTTSWGKWDGNKIKLNIKALKTGKATLTVYTKNYKSSTAKKITVTVNGSGTTTKQTTATQTPAAVQNEGNPYYVEIAPGFFIIFDGGELPADISSEISSGSTGAAASPAEMADEVISIVNEKRAEQGLSALTKDDTLMSVAATRAAELVSTFSHTRPDGTDCFTAFYEAGFTGYALAENIAMGQRSASEVMNSWMNSSGHKANILNSSYSRIGVGCYQSGGTYYWVQEFSS